MQFDTTDVDKQLAELRANEEETLVQRAAEKRGIPYVNLASSVVSTDALSIIPEEIAEKAHMGAFKVIGDELYIAVRNPDHPETKGALRNLRESGYTIYIYLASQKSIEKAMSRYVDIRMTEKAEHSFLDISDSALQAIAEIVKMNADVARLLNEAASMDGNQQTSRIVDIIMGSGIALGVSDIHIEPQDEDVRIRYRQDGILEDVAALDHDIFKRLVSRIKILAGLKLTITSDAQDGRFTIEYKGMEVEIRVSTIPGGYGEGIVMRILDPRGIQVGLEALGIEPFLFEILKQEASRPNGLILNTGPTGSGKTTTLYSILKYIHNPEIKILTIEDPVEYHLEGIHQTQVDHTKGYNFESGLRAAMRQDPDVILVGEIRDHETALTAMQASQTGHLVLSTLHTNDAAGAIPRLMDLEIDHATLGQSLTMVMAQRLVRKLKADKIAVAPTARQEEIIRSVLKHAMHRGIDLNRFGVNDTMTMTMYGPNIAPGSTGFKGRVGIFEAILVDDDVKDILEDHPTDRMVRAAANKQGILTLAEDAVIKILQGVTSFEEAERVVDLAAAAKHANREMTNPTVLKKPVAETPATSQPIHFDKAPEPKKPTPPILAEEKPDPIQPSRYSKPLVQVVPEAPTTVPLPSHQQKTQEAEQAAQNSVTQQTLQQMQQQMNTMMQMYQSQMLMQQMQRAYTSYPWGTPPPDTPQPVVSNTAQPTPPSIPPAPQSPERGKSALDLAVEQAAHAVEAYNHEKSADEIETEIQTLTDYLVMLEDHQKHYPDVNNSHKIDEVESMIFELIHKAKQEHIHIDISDDISKRLAQEELDLLLADLKNISGESKKDPLTLAETLKKLRTILDNPGQDSDE